MRHGRDKYRPVYMIGVAADLAGVHPQTLRIYERKRLVEPQRTRGNTRLYSEADIERLRLIQDLTQIEGINLAGVIHILELQDERDRLRAEIDEMQEQMKEVREFMRHAMQRQLVPTRKQAIVPLRDDQTMRFRRM